MTPYYHMSGTPYTAQPGSQPLTFCIAGECSNITVMNYDLRKRQIEILFIVNLSKPYNNFNFPEVLCEKNILWEMKVQEGRGKVGLGQ